jgi:hypothetical protein
VTRLAIITEALRQSFGCPQQMADAGGFSLSSAERYWRGIDVPNVVALANLVRQSPTLLAAFIEYVGLDERSLVIAAARLRHAKAELQSEWAITHADLARILDEREARLGVATDQAPSGEARPDQPENSRLLKRKEPDDGN